MRTTTIDAIRAREGPESEAERAARLLARFRDVRARTVRLAEPLSPEDCVVQSMPDASPVKWHLAHTTWFYEEFVLAPLGVARFDERFAHLFNSYYEAVGERHARPKRGMLTRPSLDEVRAYRAHVDEALAAAVVRVDAARLDVLELGLNHEQQHQELLLTDVKHLLAQNPIQPVYRRRRPGAGTPVEPAGFVAFAEGLREIGHDGRGFAFDNEGPRHRVHLNAFELATRPVTNGEYREFVDGGGYADARWWLSDGWDWVNREGIEAPLYWLRDGDARSAFTLAGRLPLDDAEPVTHVSFFEADAYARFRGARLPLEAEWEVAAATTRVDSNADDERFHPAPSAGPDAIGDPGFAAFFGDVWQWTASPYVAYPGFRAAPGALGEYNGKFMCNQMVLRGGSCATAPGHTRATYRNFFPAHARWQFSGIRLARDVR